MQERLTPRTGYEGALTNFACLKYDHDQCVSWSRKAYELTDASIRKELNDLDFICKIAGKRYKICLDEPGFCRVTYSCNFFQSLFGGCDQVMTRVPLEPYQYLIDASTVCFSERFYDWEEMN